MYIKIVQLVRSDMFKIYINFILIFKYHVHVHVSYIMPEDGRYDRNMR